MRQALTGIKKHPSTNTSASDTAHRLLAPGSTRAMMSNDVINCGNENPVGASRCETGLDNSPLYDGAQFITSTNTIDQTDVGMSALYAADSALAARQLHKEVVTATEVIVRGRLAKRF